MVQGSMKEDAGESEEPERRILVIGAGTTGNPVRRGAVLAFYGTPDASFTDFEGVILPYGYCMQIDEPELHRRTAELARLLSAGGVICWLLAEARHRSRESQKLLDWAEKTAPYFAMKYPELDHMLNHGGVVPSDPLLRMVAKPVCRRNEFAHWTETYCSANHSLTVVSPEKYQRATVICADPDGKPLGAGFPVDLGQVVVLPYVPGNRSSQFHIDAMSELSAALIEYRDNIMAEPPPWLSEVAFGEEDDIRGRLEGLAQQKYALEARLRPLEREKEILYLRDSLLEDCVVDALERHGLSVERDVVDRRIEDFFLLDSAGQRRAIGETKSADKNVKGTHITQLNSHRAQHNLDYDFPGLLVANTFCKAATAKDKDMPIDGRIIRHALHEHVLVVRTLDLLRLFDLVEKGSIEKSQLLKLLTEKPGWLRVKESGAYEVVTQ